MKIPTRRSPSHLRQLDDGWTPLHDAVEAEDEVLVNDLISKGADVNAQTKRSRTALHLAAGCEEASIAKILIENGADVNILARRNLTPLLAAAEANHIAVVDLLTSAGASVNPCADEEVGWTALHEAAHHGHLVLTERLLSLGATLDRKTSDGRTPLDCAINAHNIEVARLLLSLGGRGRSDSPAASSLFEHAVDSYDHGLAALLRSFGARPPTKTLEGYGIRKACEVQKIIDKSCGERRDFGFEVLLASLESNMSDKKYSRSDPKTTSLCSRCRKFQQRHPSHILTWFKIHPSKGHLEQSALSGCEICRLLLDTFKLGSLHGREIFLKLDDNRREQSRDNVTELCLLRIHRSDGSELSGLPIATISERWDYILSLANDVDDSGTDSDAAFLLSSYWYHSCLTAHRKCNDASTVNSSLPTRVIDVGPRDGSREPVLYETGREKGIYMALSHRWGTDLDGLVTTTLSTLESRKSGIPMASLSRTLQDAITITRRFGVSYLWVDTLCIIQDSEADWQAESVRMKDVFKNSSLTIAAANSHGHTQGIFRPRVRRRSRPCKVDPIRMPRWLRATIQGDGPIYIFREPDDVNRPLGPLDCRGWIMQEQLLSPRILYYDNGELFWNCMSLSASESYPMGLPRNGSGYFEWDSRLFKNALAAAFEVEMDYNRLHEAWMKVVENYTQRRLTYQSDKLVALLGVVGQAQSALRDRYLSGIWERALWKGLLWRVKLTSSTDLLPPRPTSCTVPSWSWASVAAPVSYDLVSSTHGFKLINQVEAIQLDFDAPLTSHMFTKRIILRGRMFKWPMTSADPNKTHLRLSQGFEPMEPKWIQDFAPYRGSEIWCLIVAENFRSAVCLGLVPKGHENGEFERIGVLQGSISMYKKMKVVIRTFTIV